MARLVWRFVEGLDLGAFYATIKAREGGVGRTPIDPKILIAQWLYATIDGVRPETSVPSAAPTAREARTRRRRRRCAAAPVRECRERDTRPPR